MAQQKAVVFSGEAHIEIMYEQISYLADGDSVLTISKAQQFFNSGSFTKSHNKYLNLGIAKDNYWVTFVMTNKSRDAADLILNLENPRLNEADIFIIINNRQQSFFRVGDYFSFKTRPLFINHFAAPFRINANDTVQVFMNMKHKGNTLQVPISVHTQNSFLQKTENNYLIIGITSGILLLTFFFSIFLYFKSGNRLFIFYSLYVLSTYLWLISTEGYGFQYFWPRHPEFATRFGPGFSIFNLATFIAVALEFTKPYDTTKWIRRFLLGVVVFTFLWGLQAFMPYVPVQKTALMSFFLKISFALYGFSLLLIMSYLLYVSIKKNRIVFFYFFTGITSVIFSILLIVQNTGHINLPVTSGTFISCGLVFEIILMTIGIANQFYQYKKDKEEMLIQYIEQQKSITQKVLDTQDRERKRISREMHDDIGAGLTQITLMSESAKENNSAQKLNDIADTSRQLVDSIAEIIWSLNPENKTLADLCAYLREQLNRQLEYSAMKYSIQLPENEKEIILTNEQRRNILLVTKEIVNNAIKYSKAENISVKGELINNDITFTVEDDGAGFDTQKIYCGNGMKNIKNRMEEIGGSLEAVSVKDKGCRFTYFVSLRGTT